MGNIRYMPRCLDLAALTQSREEKPGKKYPSYSIFIF